jgi:hypothetical protein
LADDRYKTFLLRYRYDGAEWGLHLPAKDLDDARARLKHLAYADIDGELVISVPAPLGPLGEIATAIRNAVRRLWATD